METIVGIVILVLLACGAFWGLSNEVKTMRAAQVKERKQTELYEALLRKLEEY